MLPQEFLNRIQKQLGEEFEDFLRSYDRPRAVGLRANGLKARPEVPLPFVTGPVPWAENGYYYDQTQRPGLHPWHEAGVYYLQEPSAMAPGPLLCPRPGDRILDLCAAPGGKSTQLAAAMDGQGLLVCNEYNPKRAKILARNIERMGIANALVLNETPAALARRFVGYFDRILVDAPCSGEGMFRKEEAALTDWSPETVDACARRQLEILRSAAGMLKPGGRMVYSTCTFAPQENEGLISAFLKEAPEFSLAECSAPWFSPGSRALVEDPADHLERTFRLWPHKLVGEGHFAAVLEKTGGEAEELPLQPAEKLPSCWEDFARELDIRLPRGKALSFGQSLFWAPEELPELKGLKVLRAGLELGTVQKGRFEPAHALALWLRDGANRLVLDPEGPEIAQYLQGQTLPAPGRGWTLVLAGPYSIGWGKVSGGVLKNHYPKGLRRAAK